MPKGYNIGNTGAGKTLWASLYALEWIKKHPKGHIFANYHLNLPNFNFSPNMFLDFRKLEECLILFDDISSLETIMRFTKIVANRSRKKQIELIFLAQYRTMIPKQLRAISDYKVKTKFDKYNDTLTVFMKIRDKGFKTIVYHDVIKTVKRLNLYDTNEVVDDPTESEVIEEIIRLSKTKKDVEKNLMIYSGNKAERKSLLKEILKKMSIQDENSPEEEELKNKQKYLFYILNKNYNDNMRKIANFFKTNLTDIHNKINQVKFELDELHLEITSS